jgi:hypothetical protein
MASTFLLVHTVMSGNVVHRHLVPGNLLDTHIVPRNVLHLKVYKFKVVSTSFNDDIYSIEILYLEERLHVSVNILAMDSLVL